MLHAHYCVEHMLLPVAYACDAICMQDWLEQIAFVCFVSLPPRGRGRTGEAEKERAAWACGRLEGRERGLRSGSPLSLALCDDRDEFDNEKDSTVGDLDRGKMKVIAAVPLPIRVIN